MRRHTAHVLCVGEINVSAKILSVLIDVSNEAFTEIYNKQTNITVPKLWNRNISHLPQARDSRVGIYVILNRIYWICLPAVYTPGPVA